MKGVTRHSPIAGIILARMDSHRLPGKALRRVAGLPLIGYVVERARKVSGLDALALATTDRPVDDRLAHYAASVGLNVFRGPVDDVALRVLECARKLEAAYFVRFNGDSPFLDPDLVALGITHCQTQQVDFVTNLIDRTYPYGVSVEIVRTAAYEDAYSRMTTRGEKEHVTRYLYDHPDAWDAVNLTRPRSLQTPVRLTVDTAADLRAFQQVVQAKGKGIIDASVEEVVAVYESLRKGKHGVRQRTFSKNKSGSSSW